MTLRTNWSHGEKAELARRVGVSPGYISDLLHGVKRALPERAEEIAAHAQAMGLQLNRDDLMFPEQSKNPLMEVPE